jgi:streptogramin lyase
LPRFIAVTATPGGDLVLLDSLGELRRLTPEGHLVSITRLPAGHYHRTNMAVTPDGSIVVSSGFHIRHLYGVSPAGAVTTIARDLGDPAGVAVDRSGAIYLAEAAHHRIVRIRPTR